METEMAVFELRRMFVGDLDIVFTLEVMARTGLMYGYTAGLVRLLGKRGMRQLAPFELVIIIALGSAVGDPMLYPDVPLLHGMAVITVVVGLQRAVSFATERSPRLEEALESRPALVVFDGRLLPEQLERERLAPDELFSGLRERQIENLGEVREAYLEPTGMLSVFRFRDGEGPEYGLPLLPPPGGKTHSPALAGSPTACLECGTPTSRPTKVCGFCGAKDHWTPAAPVLKGSLTDANVHLL